MFKTIEAIKEATDAILRENGAIKVEDIRWQNDLCVAHAEFNGWRGQCPVSMDDCIISKIIESNGDIERWREYQLGKGINAGQVMDVYFADGGRKETLLSHPSWLICLAEYIHSRRAAA